MTREGRPRLFARGAACAAPNTAEVYPPFVRRGGCATYSCIDKPLLQFKNLISGVSYSHVHTRSRSPKGGAGVPWLGRRGRPPPRPDGLRGLPNRTGSQPRPFGAAQDRRLRHQGEMISLFCRPSPLSEVTPQGSRGLTCAQPRHIIQGAGADARREGDQRRARVSAWPCAHSLYPAAERRLPVGLRLRRPNPPRPVQGR